MFLIVDALAFEGEENSMSNEFGRSAVGKNVIVSKNRERGLRFQKSDLVEVLSRAEKAS